MTYRTESHLRRAGERVFVVVSLTPEFRPAERRAAREEAERRLYAVFCRSPARGEGGGGLV